MFQEIVLLHLVSKEEEKELWINQSINRVLVSMPRNVGRQLELGVVGAQGLSCFNITHLHPTVSEGRIRSKRDERNSSFLLSSLGRFEY